MSLLDIKELSLSFGDKILYKNAELSLFKGEHKMCIRDRDTSSEAIRSGKIDAVTIGRQLLADGEYCAKVQAGEIEDICLLYTSRCV